MKLVFHENRVKGAKKEFTNQNSRSIQRKLTFFRFLYAELKHDWLTFFNFEIAFIGVCSKESNIFVSKYCYQNKLLTFGNMLNEVVIE